jgi:hypothetical protein
LVMNLLATAFGPMRAAGIELLIAGTFLLAATAARGGPKKDISSFAHVPDIVRRVLDTQ